MEKPIFRYTRKLLIVLKEIDLMVEKYRKSGQKCDIILDKGTFDLILSQSTKPESFKERIPYREFYLIK